MAKFKAIDFKADDPAIAKLIGCAVGDKFKVPVWDLPDVKPGDERVPLVTLVSITDMGLQAGETFGATPDKAIVLLRRKPAIVAVSADACAVLPEESPLRMTNSAVPAAPVAGGANAEPTAEEAAKLADEDPNALAAARAAGAPIPKRGRS